jgi:hypothetical protein
LLLSPFKFDTPISSTVSFPNLVAISSVNYTEDTGSHIDFPLSTAAVLSARFPFVTPVGWFDRRSNDKSGNPIKTKSRLADGGYFENSGFSTAYEIGQGLEKIIENEMKKDKNYPKNLKIIYLALTNNPPTNQVAGGGNELLSPMNALFNARDARGRSIIKQAEYTIDGQLVGNQKNDIHEHQVRQFYLTHFKDDKKDKVKPCRFDKVLKKCEEDFVDLDFTLPLGWYLSKYSQDYIRDRIGNPDACPPDDKLNKHPNASNNHCIIQSVIDELDLTK